MNYIQYCVIYSILLLVGIQDLEAQRRRKVQYQPVTGMSRQETWPIVAQSIEALGLRAESFDVGSGTLVTSWYGYTKGIVPNRCHIQFVLTGDVLEVNCIDLQLKQAETGEWAPTYPDPLFPKEKKIRAEVAEAIRQIQQDEEMTTRVQEGFSNNISFHRGFFESATAIAGEAWYGMYLEDQGVSWNLRLVEVERSESEEFTYQESWEVIEADPALRIIRFTNSDQHVFSNQGASKTVEGTCVEIRQEDDRWILVLEGE